MFHQTVKGVMCGREGLGEDSGGYVPPESEGWGRGGMCSGDYNFSEVI